MNKINLITQYFRSTDKTRQYEITVVLKQNCNNKYIDKIHLLLEENQNLDFLNEYEQSKIIIKIINKRLTYKDCFNYYNQNLSNTYCIIANADIYFDNSLFYLDNINFNKIIISLVRYEHEYNRLGNVLYGLEFGNKTECIYSQDCWIFKDNHINIKNSDIYLGLPGCDNLIIKSFIDSDYKVINCSNYISCNHYDHYSKNEDGSKGKKSKFRERIGNPKDYIYINKGNIILDKYIKNFQNQIIENKININCESDLMSLSYFIDNKSQIEVSSSKNKIILLNNYFIWEPLEEDDNKTIIIRYNTCMNIECLDIKNSSYIEDESNFFKIKKIKISYKINSKNWIDINKIFDIPEVYNYDYINRIYLPFQIYCNSIKIKIIEYTNRPLMKLNILVNKKGCVKLLDMNNMKFKKFVINCLMNNNYRYLLEYNNLHLDYCNKLEKTTILYDGFINYDLTKNIDYISSIEYDQIINNKKHFISNYPNFIINSNFVYTKNIINEQIEDGICIIICIMNRRTNLLNYMDSWLQSIVNQIIIIDWSSNDTDLVFKFIKDKEKGKGKIRYIRVIGEKTYIRTYAQNLGARFSKYNKILKLDSDITLSKDFFIRNIINPGEFLSGNFLCARNQNEEYTHGNLFVNINDFFKINGYCEFITTYGNDDIDINYRLQVIGGLKERLFDLDTIYHNPHDDKSRFSNLTEIKDINEEMVKNQKKMNKLPLWNRYFALQEYNIIDLYDFYECSRNQ